MGRRFKHRSRDWGEKILIFLIVIFSLLLIISQALLYKDSSRQYLSFVDKAEGDSVLLRMPVIAEKPVTITDNSLAASRGISSRSTSRLAIKILSPTVAGDIFVKVNGIRRGDFRDGEVDCVVYEGDYVEIDARSSEEAVKFSLEAEGPELTFAPNRNYFGRQGNGHYGW